MEVPHKLFGWHAEPETCLRTMRGVGGVTTEDCVDIWKIMLISEDFDPETMKRTDRGTTKRRADLCTGLTPDDTELRGREKPEQYEKRES